MTLECGRCHEHKDEEQFYFSSKYRKKTLRNRVATRGYRSSWCKSCKRDYDGERRELLRERFRAQALKNYLVRAADGRHSFYQTNRRARKVGAHIALTIDEWRDVLASPACHWCGTALHPSIRNIDHVVPLADGGEHTRTNLVAACANCNHRRRWEQITKYAKERGL